MISRYLGDLWEGKGEAVREEDFQTEKGTEGASVQYIVSGFLSERESKYMMSEQT